MKMIKVPDIILVCAFMTLIVTIWYQPQIVSKKDITPYVTVPLRKTMRRPDIKYILQWTKPYIKPFVFMERGRRTFIRRRCFFDNCFVTSYRNYLKHIIEFDAILFNGPELISSIIRLPSKRHLWQKYVFVSRESSANYPFYHNLRNVYNNFFNWTWTYRLNSDIYYGYLIIKNKEGYIIGPKKVMHWLKLEEMKPIDENVKKKLQSKKFVAAWFVSNCNTTSKREEIAKLLQQELAKYDMKVDIYGGCGNKICLQSTMPKCLKMLETDYYFYLAFENSLTFDYVTEKVLHALQHYTIPIVYGGANYTRFMPEGSYLNVQSQSIEALVKKMMEIMNDKQKYYDYFRWTNHYSYHHPEEFPETDYYCEFCRKINDYKSLTQTRYLNFNKWWNPNTKKNKMTSKSLLQY
ncbi:hypothetical protein PYW08_016677 [Mythimna loreyi]|uniref:Uncharacterized protein n=1 Tax=Mythimna loreyi TaxID=667449 RepID=A0ACC2QY27_9NEOP|nr:hypothetical protein PYW08_016677 [Mythimna loreyi]